MKTIQLKKNVSWNNTIRQIVFYVQHLAIASFFSPPSPLQSISQSSYFLVNQVIFWHDYLLPKDFPSAVNQR